MRESGLIELFKATRVRGLFLLISDGNVNAA